MMRDFKKFCCAIPGRKIGRLGFLVDVIRVTG